MIASSVTITDDHFGFVMTKFNKNVQEFMEDYCYRQGKIIEKNDNGFVAELHSSTHLNDDTVIGKMHVIF